MKYSFVTGMLVGAIMSYGLMIGVSYALEQNEFVMSRDEVINDDGGDWEDEAMEQEGELFSEKERSSRDGRRVSRSTICNDCMDGMGKILYDISYLSSTLAEVQEKLLDTVYGYAKKKKTGFLAEGSRVQLQDFHNSLMNAHAKVTEAINASSSVIGLVS